MKRENHSPENLKNINTVEEAVKAFQHENEDGAIDYLRRNQGDVTEFCYQIFESYQEGDKTGLVELGMLIKRLL